LFLFCAWQLIFNSSFSQTKNADKFSLALSDKNLPKDLNNMVFFK